MASYEKRGSKWTVRFRIDDTNKRLSGYDTKKDAEQAYVKAVSVAGANKNSLTLDVVFDMFKDYKRIRIKESTYCSFVQIITDYVIPYFGTKKISNITVAQISEWQSKIDQLPIKYRTKDNIYTTFVNLMNYAVKFHALAFNPVSKVGNFKNNELKPQMDFWTQEEFAQFITIVDDLTYKAFFSTLYLTGARKGEVMALTWQDVDFANCTLSISKTYSNKGGGHKITPPKTKSSNRQILLTASLTSLLKSLHDQQQAYEGYTPKCFIFGFSRPLAPSSIERKKQEYCKKANVKQIRIHDFRHSHASLLLNKGQNILLVAQRLGHSDVNMTLNTYSHLFPNQQRQIIGSIDIDVHN